MDCLVCALVLACACLLASAEECRLVHRSEGRRKPPLRIQMVAKGSLAELPAVCDTCLAASSQAALEEVASNDDTNCQHGRRRFSVCPWMHKECQTASLQVLEKMVAAASDDTLLLSLQQKAGVELS